jgi:hypothetical protein
MLDLVLKLTQDNPLLHSRLPGKISCPHGSFNIPWLCQNKSTLHCFSLNHTLGGNKLLAGLFLVLKSFPLLNPTLLDFLIFSFSLSCLFLNPPSQPTPPLSPLMSLSAIQASLKAMTAFSD